MTFEEEVRHLLLHDPEGWTAILKDDCWSHTTTLVHQCGICAQRFEGILGPDKYVAVAPCGAWINMKWGLRRAYRVRRHALKNDSATKAISARYRKKPKKRKRQA